jgi:hypothetical protein
MRNGPQGVAWAPPWSPFGAHHGGVTIPSLAAALELAAREHDARRARVVNLRQRFLGRLREGCGRRRRLRQNGGSEA